VTKVTRIIEVTPVNFANWIKHRTSVSKTFPTEHGRLTLYQAKVSSGTMDNPSLVTIEGLETIDIEREGKLPIIQSASHFRVPYIQFEIVPVNKGTKIIGVCGNAPTLQEYCAELLAEIEKESKGAQDTMTDASKMTKWSRGDKIACAGLIVAILAIIVSILLALASLQEASQNFTYPGTPTLTPIIALPTATP
jgi:hypothetical protein